MGKWIIVSSLLECFIGISNYILINKKGTLEWFSTFEFTVSVFNISFYTLSWIVIKIDILQSQSLYFFLEKSDFA